MGEQPLYENRPGIDGETPVCNETSPRVRGAESTDTCGRCGSTTRGTASQSLSERTQRRGWDLNPRTSLHPSTP